MKTLVKKITIVFSPLMFLLFSICLVFVACDKDEVANPGTSYQKVNLVSSVDGHGANRIDPNLINARGMAVGQTGTFWITSTGIDKTTIYDYTGMTAAPPFNVGGHPEGVVYNATNDFARPVTTMVSKFIYVGEEGKVHGWASENMIVEVANHGTNGDVYKGVTITNDRGSNFLYIANFSKGEIVVLDQNFVQKDGMLFIDPTLPAGYAPFNIQNVDGKLYVTYALQNENSSDAVEGEGNGYVSIFNPDGTFIRRFASEGKLNAPWGIAKVTNNFGEEPNAILIGNNGDGRINVFSENGEFLHQLQDGNTIIKIDGLWTIMFPASGVPAIEHNKLYYTAGPADETQGLFGYITMR